MSLQRYFVLAVLAGLGSIAATLPHQGRPKGPRRARLAVCPAYDAAGQPGGLPLPLPASIRKLPAGLKVLTLAERDKHMPANNPKSFMQQLDDWTQFTIIDQLVYVHAEEDDEAWKRTTERIKQAVRQKVLESYRNGQSARQRHAATGGERREMGYGR